MPKQIAVAEEARARLVQGMDIVADAVKSTLGPKGRNVALGRKLGAPIITHDGVTVARHIDLEDPFENMGAQLIKEAASRTNETAGDGTTTSALLAQAIIREGLKNIAAGANAVMVRRGVQRAADAAISSIREQAVQLQSESDIAQIASIAAADPVIGQLIAEAMAHVGTDGAVSVEESQGMDLEIEHVEGMSLERGYLSPFFVSSDHRMVADLEHPYILLTDQPISSVVDIRPALEQLPDSGSRSLLVIADDVTDEALTTLVMNHLRGRLACAAIKAPEYGERRRELLEDIATVTGGAVLALDVGRPLDSTTLADFGRCRRALVDRERTTIVGGEGGDADVQFRIEETRRQLDSAENDRHRSHLENRLAKLSGGVSVIKVGGATETEIKEKTYRVEDALNATRAAISEGIVPGGGIALLNAAEALNQLDGDDDESAGVRAVRFALQEPVRQIAENAGLDGAVVLQEIRRRQRTRKNRSVGFNVVTERYVDLMKAGIVDPAKVVRNALLNAASVAAMVHTVGALVAEIPDDSPTASAPDAGGGGPRIGNHR